MKHLKTTHTFTARVWIYPGDTKWHFVYVPKNIAKEIHKNFGNLSRGWGSLPVEIKIKKSKWKTSIFRDNKSQSYLLPIKASIRKKEIIQNNDDISINLKILLDL